MEEVSSFSIFDNIIYIPDKEKYVRWLDFRDTYESIFGNLLLYLFILFRLTDLYDKRRRGKLVRVQPNLRRSNWRPSKTMMRVLAITRAYAKSLTHVDKAENVRHAWVYQMENCGLSLPMIIGNFKWSN